MGTNQSYSNRSDQLRRNTTQQQSEQEKQKKVMDRQATAEKRRQDRYSDQLHRQAEAYRRQMLNKHQKSRRMAEKDAAGTDSILRRSSARSRAEETGKDTAAGRARTTGSRAGSTRSEKAAAQGTRTRRTSSRSGAKRSRSQLELALWRIKKGAAAFADYLVMLYQRAHLKEYGYMLFPVCLIYEEILLRIFSGQFILKGLWYELLGSVCLGMLLFFLVGSFRKRTGQFITMGILAVTGFWFVLESIVHSSYKVYMSLAGLTQGAGGVTTKYTSIFIRAILVNIPRIILFFLPFILYTIVTLRMPLPKMRRRRKKRPRSLSPLGVAAACLILLVLTAGSGRTRSIYAANYNFNSATNTFGLLTSTRLDMQYSIFGRPSSGFHSVDEDTTTLASADEETEGEDTQPDGQDTDAQTQEAPVQTASGRNEMNLDYVGLAKASGNSDAVAVAEHIVSLPASDKNEYTGLFKGKNLIIICAEAFSDAVVSEKLTPTLYRLIHDGIYFSDYYQPAWGGSTITGEFSTLFGLAPYDEVNSFMDVRDHNNYFTMANQLGREGYNCLAFHNGEYDYYDRDKTHTTFGYTDFIALGSGLEELTGDWPDDDVCFDKTMDLYMNKGPFCVYYMTISGHAPYNDPNDYRVLANIDRVRAGLGEAYDTYERNTINFFCLQLELEDALKVMVEKLEQNGLADDTVIVMTADHYPYGLEESDEWGNDTDCVADLLKHDDYYSWDQDKNGLILWSGCLEHQQKNMAKEISSPTFSLDILPTLSNLFGLSFDSRLLAGRDVFSDQEPIVFWNNLCWTTDQGRFFSENETYFPKEGYAKDPGYIDRINRIVANRLMLSRKIIETDFYGILFN